MAHTRLLFFVIVIIGSKKFFYYPDFVCWGLGFVCSVVVEGELASVVEERGKGVGYVLLG